MQLKFLTIQISLETCKLLWLLFDEHFGNEGSTSLRKGHSSSQGATQGLHFIFTFELVFLLLLLFYFTTALQSTPTLHAFFSPSTGKGTDLVLNETES